MGKTTIEWTDYTFNTHWGCTKISPGCDHCYAEVFDKRVGGDHWGSGRPRREMSDAYWRQPLAWQRSAVKAGRRRRVFCASMADVFDKEAPVGVLDRLWTLIRETPTLDWLLLTKRPQRIHKSLPEDWGPGWPNVWLGTSVEDQTEADRRIPHLMGTPAGTRFLSCEPLLGPIDLNMFLRTPTRPDWIIIGGESGPGHRRMDVGWGLSLVGQAREAGVALFVKQDSGLYPGKQGRFSDEVWAMKEWPR